MSADKERVDVSSLALAKQAIEDLLEQQVMITRCITEALEALNRYSPETHDEVSAKLATIAQYLELRRNKFPLARSMH